MPKNVLLTGGTGFVGSHLTHRLLQEGHCVTALARGSRTESARDRITRALSRIAGNGRPDVDIDRLHVLEGDITAANLGMHANVAQSVAGKMDELWHCAASLSFTEEAREEIFRMNVDGTRNVLDFVERSPARRLHHVSTAYVAGI